MRYIYKLFGFNVSYVFKAIMKPSLDSDEEEELGALQKTLRGDVFKQRKDDAVHKIVMLKMILQKTKVLTSLFTLKMSR